MRHAGFATTNRTPHTRKKPAKTTSPLFTGRPGSTKSDITRGKAGVTFDAGPGHDLVLGSAYADTLKGGADSDALFGNGGADVLQGGIGIDAVSGGAGNDTFVFVAGDLVTSRASSNGYGGLVDAVLAFRGAGTSGSGEQDVIWLEGFGAGTALSFAGYAGSVRSLQYYEVVDPTTPGADVVVVPPPPNAAPTDVVLSNATVAENGAAGDVVGQLAATDPDASDTATFALVDDAGGRFALAPDGRTLVTTGAFDFEAGQTQFTVRVRATDRVGATVERDLVVEVTNVDEAPAFAADSFVFALAENNAPSAAVGTLVATDPEGGALAYAILENADGDAVNDVPFAVDASGRVTATAALDREGRAQYAFTLQATDAGGLSDTVTVTVNVDDVEERRLDLVTANVVGDSVSVSVFRQTGAGGFARTDVAAGDGSQLVALGDLDGPARLTDSGLPDLGPLVPVLGGFDPLLF